MQSNLAQEEGEKEKHLHLSKANQLEFKDQMSLFHEQYKVRCLCIVQTAALACMQEAKSKKAACSSAEIPILKSWKSCGQQNKAKNKKKELPHEIACISVTRVPLKAIYHSRYGFQSCSLSS